MNIFSYNNKYLIKDDKPWFPVMGEFHYSRYPKEFWRDELFKMKAGGVNVVSSYVIWIHHEEIENEYDFTENKDLRYFVECCRECGIFMFLRIGPWSHAEARNGGFPDWLIKKHPNARTNDEGYLAEVKKFYQRIYKEVKGEFIGDGGAIIGVQIENEYGHCGGLQGEDGENHMRTLTSYAKEIGYDVPLYTATGWGGAVTGGLLPVMGGYCDAPWDISTKKLEPSGNYVITHERNDHGIGSDHHIGYGVTFDFNDFPYLTAELGGGLQVTHHRRPLSTGKDIGAMSLTKLASGVTLLGYYMYHGGTNPHGKLTTLQESKATGYLNDLPEYSYDFNAPLKEYGQPSDAFKEIKLLSMFLADFGSELCKMDAYIPDCVPDKPENLKDLRYSVRHDGTSGYVFVNNYQRLYTMAKHNNYTLTAHIGNVKYELPEMDILNEDYFFYPLNMKLKNAALKYMMATPLCILNEDTYVFYSDKPAPYELDGIAKIMLISRNDALNSYKIKLDKEYLVIADGIVRESENGYVLHRSENAEIKSYPAFKNIPNGFILSRKDGEFTVYTKVCSDSMPSAEIKINTISKSVKRYTINMDYDNCNGYDECFVTLKYYGDSAKLYIDGKLEDDDFYTGDGWTTGLKRYGYPEKFEVEIYSLNKNDDIYLEIEPTYKNGVACDVGCISVRAEYLSFLVN